MSSALSATALAGGLAVVGLLAAGPASALLARAEWPTRSPTVALVLWQAVCLCAGLSLTGAAVVIAVEPLDVRLPGALIALLRNTFDGAPSRGMTGWQVLLLVIAALFASTLLAVLIRCLVLVVRRRRAHREILDLLTMPAGTRPPGTVPDEVRILDHATPIAYGVPGWHTRLVLTAGLIDLLSAPQLAAVVAHERAHLRSHHDLLLLPFQAWAAALGRLPGVRAARDAVATLAEMHADDAAARQVDPQTVASALARVVLAGRPADQAAVPPDDRPANRAPALPTGFPSELPQVAGTAVVRRVRRLQHPHPLSGPAMIAGYLAAAVVLLAPTIVLFVGWRR